MKGAATATAYAASKWAVRGISQCWQAELRPHGIRVICICPSEVQTNFGGRAGRNNPNKLYAADIARTIMAGAQHAAAGAVAGARGVRQQPVEGVAAGRPQPGSNERGSASARRDSRLWKGRGERCGFYAMQ